jgi:hypothetical protein
LCMNSVLQGRTPNTLSQTVCARTYQVQAHALTLTWILGPSCILLYHI